MHTDTTVFFKKIPERGHSIPNQQNPTFWVFMKFGTEINSTKKLSHTKIWLILFSPVSLHIMFNIMAITLPVNVIEFFRLFWDAYYILFQVVYNLLLLKGKP